MVSLPNTQLETPPAAIGGLASDRLRTLSMRALLSRYSLLAVLVSVTTTFCMLRLDNAYLSIGESNTALLGKNVLLTGFPKAWDGHYLVVPYYERTLNDQLVWVANPWLQYYLAAISIRVFGQSGFAARLPFALSGVLGVIAIYYLGLRISGSDRFAQLSALILALHPVFWLYSRQSRYYAPTMLLMIVVTLAYLKWADVPCRRYWILFVASSTLLFYALYTIWAFLMLAIGLYYLAFNRTRENFVQFTSAAAAICSLTLPWFLYAPPRFYFDAPPTFHGYWNRLVVHLWKIHTLYYPFLTLLVVLGLVVVVDRFKKKRIKPSDLRLRKEYLLLISVPAYVIFVVLYPFFTTHYMLPAIPFGALIAAYLILKIREHNRWIASAALATMLFTNLPHVAPYLLLDKFHLQPARAELLFPNPTATMTPGTPLAHYLTEQLKLRFFVFDFCYFLTHDYKHHLKATVAFLKDHSTSDETVSVPWNDANAVSFYTGLNVNYHTDTPFLSSSVMQRLMAASDRRADWIVPHAIDLQSDYYLSNKFLRNYQKIRLQGPKEYFETYPNIEFFNFRTNTDAPSSFYIFHAKAPGA